MKLKSAIAGNPILLLLILCFIISIIFIPNFTTFYNLKNYCLQASDLLIIASGLTFVILNGGIDFSVTSILSLCSVVGAYIMALSPLSESPALSIPVAILVMLLIGGIIGTINGLAITRLKMPSFIATLSTQLAVSGIAILFANIVSSRTSIFGMPDSYFIIGGEGKYYFIPIIIALVSCGFANWLLERTRFGRNILMVGTNPTAAYISGINVKKVIFIITLLSGLYASLASVIMTARNQAGIASMGDKMFISIVASIIIGGTSIMGGSGGFKQTFIGVLFITLLNNVMNLLGISWFMAMVVQGILILIAATFDFINRSKQARKTA